MSSAGSFSWLTYWWSLEPSADGSRSAFSFLTSNQVSTFCPLLSALKSTLTEVTGPRGAAVLVSSRLASPGLLAQASDWNTEWDTGVLRDIGGGSAVLKLLLLTEATNGGNKVPVFL